MYYILFYNKYYHFCQKLEIMLINIHNIFPKTCFEFLDI